MDKLMLGQGALPVSTEIDYGSSLCSSADVQVTRVLRRGQPHLFALQIP